VEVNYQLITTTVSRLTEPAMFYVNSLNRNKMLLNKNVTVQRWSFTMKMLTVVREFAF